MRKTLRLLVRVVAVAATLGSAVGVAAAAEPFPVVFGDDFTLVDQNGRTRSSREFRGRLLLVYFGYTACPHSCGMALATMSAALDALGPDADAVAPLFVTVDPGHDTPDRLAAHLRNFHPAIVGLTGSAAAIGALSDGYRVTVEAVADPGAFERLIDHTTYIYVVGRDGAALSLLPPMLPPRRIAAILRSHM